MDGSAAPKPPVEETKRPEPPSPEALYLRRALPAASPAKPPPPKPTVSPVKPKPRPPPSPARSSVSWSATPPRKPKAAEFMENAFDQKHEQPEVAVLRHARDVIREAASSLEISITGKKGPTTPRAAALSSHRLPSRLALRAQWLLGCRVGPAPATTGSLTASRGRTAAVVAAAEVTGGWATGPGVALAEPPLQREASLEKKG